MISPTPEPEGPYLDLEREAIATLAQHTTMEAELILVRDEGCLAESYNKGFKMAKGNLYACLHNDVIVPEGWDETMTPVAQAGDVAMPMLQEGYAYPGIPHWSERDCPPSQFDAPASNFMISAELFNRLDGFDEDFKPYHGEDIDLFLRASLEGAKLVRCDVTFRHFKGVSRKSPEEDKRVLEQVWKTYKAKWGEKPPIMRCSPIPGTLSPQEET